MSAFSSLPSLALLCRSYAGMWGELLPSLQLFDIYWPDEYEQSRFVWVLDDESDADHMLRNAAGTDAIQRPQRQSRRALRSQARQRHACPRRGAGYGYARQQYSNMYCDKYTDAEYVGIVDSDSWPIRPPLPSDLFSLRSDGQYRALLVGYNGVSPWCIGAKYLVGRPCPAEFMIRFPVLVKTVHFALMRRHITAHRNTSSFEEAYQSMLELYGREQYGQFNIIATYLFHFHYDEYEWRINSCGPACHHPTRSQLMYTNANDSDTARLVLATNQPAAQLMKHVPINTNDMAMLTNLFPPPLPRIQLPGRRVHRAPLSQPALPAAAGRPRGRAVPQLLHTAGGSV